MNHPKPTFEIAGIGNAIVDVLAMADDAFLKSENIAKGGMTLIDEARATALYEKMGTTTECSGGSVANSLAGFASLGGKAAFIGKVRDDQLGDIFRHDMRGIGVHFTTPAATGGAATARCLILVTPDAQRTMNTFIGACSQVSEADIDEAIIQASAMTYIEGYLWDQPEAKKAIRKAMDVARKAGRKVALTLSDTFCVERHRAEFLELVEGKVDILFANEAEIKALYQSDDFDAAVSRVRGKCAIAAITRSEKGCVVVGKDEVLAVPGEVVCEVVDTTGAGDLFAAGFLYGYCKGWEVKSAARLGNLCAAQIITQVGARSLKPLDHLLAA